jgi:hypothetical protein
MSPHKMFVYTFLFGEIFLKSFFNFYKSYIKGDNLKFMYISIYKEVGERSFSICELWKVFTSHSRPFDGQQRCVDITPSYRYRSSTFGAEPKIFFSNPILHLLHPSGHPHTFHHSNRQSVNLGGFEWFLVGI